MKKYLSTLAVVSAISSFNVSANDVTWGFAVDTTLDGNIDSPTFVELTGKMFSKKVYLNSSVDPNVIATGRIESASASDAGAGSVPRIYLTAAGSSTFEYVGSYVGGPAGDYHGVWFGPNGEKGDFIIRTIMGGQPGDGSADTLMTFDSVTESTFGSSTQKGEKVIDQTTTDNGNDVWVSAYNDANPTIILQTSEAVVPTEYHLTRGYCRGGNEYLPGTWTLYASNDGNNWTAVDAVLNPDQGPNFPHQTACTDQMLNDRYVIDHPGIYTFYKFEFTASQYRDTQSVTGVSIGEVRFYH